MGWLTKKLSDWAITITGVLEEVTKLPVTRSLVKMVPIVGNFVADYAGHAIDRV